MPNPTKLNSFNQSITKPSRERSARKTPEQSTSALPRRPRILMVTPEISYLPSAMENGAPKLSAKAGGLADVAATLVNELSGRSADVHVALPNYRNLFGEVTPNEERVHLAQDRSFYYRDQVYNGSDENILLALAFQREVINTIIPMVQPDIIHCHDWTSGLVPSAARRMGIPCMFTIHNIHTELLSLAQIEDHGIDAAAFWESLYFENAPNGYEHTREHNRVDFLTSGIFAADYVNTVSPSFLDEITGGQYDFVPAAVRTELTCKHESGQAGGILNSPDPSYSPETDSALAKCYNAAGSMQGKSANKLAFQEELGLDIDADAPLFLWPSRLDPIQKGCDLLSHLLIETIERYGESGVQFAFIADGSSQQNFHEIVSAHDLQDRVAVHKFDERLSRLGYAASDFTLMPSRFEPCGLSQMVAAKYGSLPIVHHTGGLRDTVRHLDLANGSGNGFVFNHFDTEGLRWAISQAMEFFTSPRAARDEQVARVMIESREEFCEKTAFASYLKIYNQLANGDLFDPDSEGENGMVLLS